VLGIPEESHGCPESLRPGARTGQKAQETAQKAREDAESAQKDLAEAQQASNQARQAQAAADQRASQAADQAQRAQQAANPAKPSGVTESQGPGAAQGQHEQPKQQPQPAQKTVLIASGVLFATGSADISEQTKARLDNLASALSSKPQANNVIISGHTDDVGDPQANLALSDKRAHAVADYLESKGVPRERIVTRAVGERNSVGTENNAQDRAANRRVDILVRPVQANGQGGQGGLGGKGVQEQPEQNAPQSPPTQTP